MDRDRELRLVAELRAGDPTAFDAVYEAFNSHLHASHCRSRLLEDTHAAGLLGLWPSGRPEPSPLVAAEASETERRVVEVLASLPLTYREALLLVGVEGLQPAEAAAICGVSAETMRQRLRRARAML